MKKYTATVVYAEDVMTVEAKDKKEAEQKVYDLLSSNEQEQCSQIIIVDFD